MAFKEFQDMIFKELQEVLVVKCHCWQHVCDKRDDETEDVFEDLHLGVVGFNEDYGCKMESCKK